MPPTTGVSGSVFGEGCDKSHIGAMLGTEAKLRGSADIRCHQLFREAAIKGSREIRTSGGGCGSETGRRRSQALVRGRSGMSSCPEEACMPFGRRQAASPTEGAWEEQTI